jgi:hypothetical protein
MLALEDENGDKAEALAKKLEEIQKKNAEIAADLLAIGATPDPFSTWAGSLSLALIALGKLGKTMADVPGLVPGVNFNPSQNADRNYDMKVAAVNAAVAGGSSTSVADAVVNAAEAIVEDAAAAILANAGKTFNPSQNADRNYDDKIAAEAAAAAALAAAATNVSESPMAANGGFGFSLPSYLQNSIPQTPTIIVNNNGSVIMQDEFIDVVNDAVLASYRFGYGTTPAGAIL